MFDPNRLVLVHNGGGKKLPRYLTLDAMWRGESNEAWKRVFLPIENYHAHLKAGQRYFACSPTYFDKDGKPYQTT